MSKYTAIIGEDGEYILQCDGSRIGEILFFHDASHIVATLNRAEQPTPTAVPAAVSDGELTVEQIVEIADKSEFTDPDSGNPQFDRLGFARDIIAAYRELRAALKAQPAPTEAQGDSNSVEFEGIKTLQDASKILDPYGAFAKFKSWADDNLGQGYSLAMEDHTFIDPVTRWAFAGYRAGLQAVQGEDSARLDASDLATIEEATKVLESAAKHNEGLGRTVFAHAQRDRATRLRAILNRVTKQPQEAES